jgi:hypothetical protein
MSVNVFDSAQAALSFLIPQLAHIEPEIYQVKYPEIRYPAILPVDTSAKQWATSVMYFSGDIVGQAQWASSNAGDVPLADVTRAQFATPVHMATIGYEYSEEELAQAKMLGIPLTVDKGVAARRVAERFIDDVAMTGDVSKGFTGLFNSPSVTVVAAPSVAGVTSWLQKTPPEILADVNGLITGVYTGSNTVELADTLLLPVAVYAYLSVTPFNAYSAMTLLEYIRKSNTYTVETDRPLKIRGVRGLDNAGSGSTPSAMIGRAIAYTNDKSVVKMHMPMPYQFGNAREKSAWVFEVPGRFRIGGVDVRRPGAFRYMDAVS